LSNGSALGANLVQNDFKHHKRFTTISNDIYDFKRDQTRQTLEL